jgi:hypothetical protein
MIEALALMQKSSFPIAPRTTLSKSSPDLCNAFQEQAVYLAHILFHRRPWFD